MDLYEVIDEVTTLLRQRGRLTYRALKLQFKLDDEYLEALKEELIEGQRIAADENGKVLVWTGDGTLLAAPNDASSPAQSPASYTPPHLAERIRAEQQAMESRGSANGERKTITALFADLKGSTALIEGLDPEEARAIIDPALQLMMDAVHRYEGYVAQALGDGIFALFGAPLAHEDHPQRALYAALRMQEEMRSYGDQVRLKHGVPLQMRVGINTGEVVVRSIHKDDLHTDYVPVGHSTNLAARMEQLAIPGSIVVSEYTRKLTEGYFELRALGAATIKGLEAPLDVYEVIGAGPFRTRFQMAARRGLSRFVGRQSELAQLEQALVQAKAGHGQIVGVTGEPGLGKSRLFYEFKLLAQSGCLVLEAFSVSHGKASPYQPLIELLKTYFQIEPTDNERTRRAKVMGQVLALDESLDDVLPYLLALLGFDEPASPLQQMDAQVRRQQTFEALKRLFLRESLNQPLIFICEDLHWLDTETQGFLDTLAESVGSAQLLLLVNYRPEYRHEWGHKTYYTQLRLAPLGEAEAEELLAYLLGRDESLNEVKRLILEKTEGTPFFLEEVVQTLVEEGALIGSRGNYRLDTTPAELHISPTVQGVLAARIDRLTADEKTLLQQLSVIGRQFPIGLIKKVVSQPEAELHRLLVALQAKEFLYEQPAFPEVEYLFKHALTQEVAYGTLLQEQRKTLHERTGRALEVLYSSSLAEHYTELARHYNRSENTEQAIHYLDLAGQQAIHRSANEDAILHLSTALDLLKALPNTPERTQREILLLIALGVPLQAIKGASAPEVEQAYTRAWELCQQTDLTAHFFPVLSGLQQIYTFRSNLQKAHELGEQLLMLANQAHDSSNLLVAHMQLGVTEFWRGAFMRAQEHLERGFALYSPEQHHSLAFRYGSYDPGVGCLTDITLAFWLRGYPDQATAKAEEMFALARKVSHPFSLTIAYIWGAWFSQLCRDVAATQERAEASLALSAEQNFAFWSATAAVLRGWAVAEQGDRKAGITQMQQGLTAFQNSKAHITQPHLLALLTEAYGKANQTEAGLRTLEEAFALVHKNGEHECEAELHRLKGELLLNGGREMLNAEQKSQEAEACFQQAIEVARQQEAKSWELRAAMSLARLWRQQDKTTEARDLLASVYEWFTEGFDTVDLKDAKSLLEELA